MDNVPLDLAAERHGHSVKYFTNTYGRLSVKDQADRFRSHYGLNEEEAQDKVENIKCRCGHINKPSSEYCGTCGAGLTVEASMKKSDETKELKERLNRLEKLMNNSVAMGSLHQIDMMSEKEQKELLNELDD